ncbi:transglutaminase-like domain-containing protein [Marisediminicola senii]|uniref:transglutaminase-like domain-containing protein n=1 Tax=Marisediminicola senii TaxID=2711233 RepID=UPI001F1AEEB8|nr:transglutaminase-like domain-containing protein [Marisediminicola senii]
MSARQAGGVSARSARFMAITTLLLWVATAIAAAAFWPVYQSVEFVVMVAVTTVVASIIAITGAIARLPAHIVATAMVIAAVVLGVPLAVPSMAVYGVLPTLAGLGDLAVGTVTAWKQLLTISLPVGSYEALLVPPFLLVLVTVVISLTVALRAKHPQFAVIGPIVLFLAGIVFGDVTAFLPVTLALALTGVLLLWTTWTRWFRRRRGSRALTDASASGARTLVSAALIIAVAAVTAGGAAAAFAPETDRAVLRASVVQQFSPRDYTSPLSGFRRYHQPPLSTEAVLTVAGLPQGARIRIATLDQYDGVVYSVGSESQGGISGSFTLVPDRIDQSAVSGEQVDVTVSVGAYSGVWLPTTGGLSSIEFFGADSAGMRGSFYYNANTGTGAVIGGLGTGDAYRLAAVVPDAPTGEQLRGVTPGDAPMGALGEVPDAVSVTLESFIGEESTPGAQLAAAMDGLRETGYISHGVSDDEPPSRSGHSFDRIGELLSDTRMIGDGEQYSVAAALMARELGFPARVVMGFAPTADAAGDTGDALSGDAGSGSPGSGSPGSDSPGSDSTVITGSDVSAWIEVDTAEYGWVAVDPTPPVREIPDAVPEDPTQVARPQSPVPPVEPQDPTPEEQAPPESSQDDVVVADPLLAALLVALQVLGWVVVGVVLLLSPFVAIIGAKLRRRALRRGADDPGERVRGGWREFEDTVVDHGFVPPPSATRSEFATVVGGGRPLVLAAAADRAAFGPAQTEPAEADRVWRTVDDLRRTLSESLTRRQRIRAMVSLRSLGRGGRGTEARTRNMQ